VAESSLILRGGNWKFRIMLTHHCGPPLPNIPAMLTHLFFAAFRAVLTVKKWDSGMLPQLVSQFSFRCAATRRVFLQAIILLVCAMPTS
jgi:hypothetical protein